MLQKNSILFSTGIIFSFLTFFGCGGNKEHKEITLRVDNNKLYVTNNDLEGEVTIENLNNKLSEALENSLIKEKPLEIHISNFKKIEEALAQNQAVNLALKYKKETIPIVTIFSNDKIIITPSNVIGENFLYFESGKNPEGLMRALSLTGNMTNRLQGYAMYMNPLTDLWNEDKDKTIIASSLNSASQEPSHTVNFTLQKTTTNDYQFSNIKINDVDVNPNTFVLKNDQYTTTNLQKLQLMLSTLFVNFEKSKEIFN